MNRLFQALPVVLLLGVGGASPAIEDRTAFVVLTEAAPPARQDALRVNVSLPFSAAPIEPARPFAIPTGTGDHAAALECMTTAIYYEAGYEPADGQRAVAQVVLNRMRHPAFPKSVCGVIYQGAPSPGCQFSFACDGSLARGPAPAAWRRARAVAAEALRGYVMAEVGAATHYHADWVAPHWAPHLAKVKQIGAHIFYRWPGAWGRPAAFTGRYAGDEHPFTAKVSDPEPVVEGPPERRAENDVGGRIVPGLGWTPSIPSPADSSGAMAQVLASQQAGG